MDTARITEILTDPVTLDLVERQPIMQIAYAAADGSPRAVPVGYLLREGKFLFFTAPGSDKIAALHHDPRIALTIDVYPPPCCLLVRGTAELREEYASRRNRSAPAWTVLWPRTSRSSVGLPSRRRLRLGGNTARRKKLCMTAIDERA